MNPFNAAALSGGMLTVIALYILGFYPEIPPWAIFIAWACFFHLGGGTERASAYWATTKHLGLGILAAWLSALIVLQNPFNTGLAQNLWAPIAIGLVIGGLLRLGASRHFPAPPVIIYGYAATFAFLSTAGTFSTEILLSPSADNALITLALCALMGASAGYINAQIAGWLMAWPLRSQAAPH